MCHVRGGVFSSLNNFFLKYGFAFFLLVVFVLKTIFGGFLLGPEDDGVEEEIFFGAEEHGTFSSVMSFISLRAAGR